MNWAIPAAAQAHLLRAASESPCQAFTQLWLNKMKHIMFNILVPRLINSAA